VKRILLLLVVVVAAFSGGVLWMKLRVDDPAVGDATAAKPAEEEAEGPKVTRDANGNAVITMTDEIQGDMGIQVTNPASMQMSPELKGYGHVLDPAPLTALLSELASDQAAWSVSSNELARLKTLEGQGNASARALETAQAAALRDQLAVQAARDRLALSWGKTVADQSALPAFVQSLASLETVLARIDLPVGDTLKSPSGARIVSLAGDTCEAEFLGLAPSVDPQMQGRGFLFRISANASQFSPGEAVVGYLKVPGEPLSGAVIPRNAVVRTEGAGWVYVLDTNGAEAFKRTEIPLDHPTEAGWFVTNGVAASDYVVVKGAQQLLSIELKGQGGAD
jgi:hypothetical protein